MAVRTTRPELGPDDLVQFIEYHRPRLKAGDYTVTLRQTIQDLTAAKTGHFAVLGERFALKEEDIHALYPPPHSHGPFHHNLPHVVLNHSMLPWERTPRGDHEDEVLSPSWLALLLFAKPDEETNPDAQSALPQARNVRLKDLEHAVQLPDRRSLGPEEQAKQGLWPGVTHETGQHPEDPVTVIDVPWSTLKGILPSYEDLHCISHVRLVKRTGPHSPDEKSDAPLPPEVALVMGTRLPPEGCSCAVHLVSLEKRYKPSVKPFAEGASFREITDQPMLDLLTTAQEHYKPSAPAPVELRLEADTKPVFYGSMEVEAGHGRGEYSGAEVRRLADSFLTESMRHGFESERSVERLFRLSGLGALRARLFEKHVNHEGRIVAKSVLSLRFADEGADLPDSGVDEHLQGLLEAAQRAGARQLSLQEGTSQPRFFGRLDVEGLESRSAEEVENLCYSLLPPDWKKRFDLSRDVTVTVNVRLNGETARIRARVYDMTVEQSDGSKEVHVAGALEIQPVTLLYFDHQGAEGQPDAHIRLISLKSWEFGCDREGRGFVQLMEHLNRTSPGGHAPAPQPPTGEEHVHHLPSAAFHLPLRDFTRLEDEPEHEMARRHLRSGLVPLPHFMRGGDQTFSWYRGPLIPDIRVSPAIDLPVRGPDELLIFNKQAGLFDVTYAAAWELGRLLALHDKAFSVKLYHWKGAHAQHLTYLRQRIDHDYLPLMHGAPPEGLTDELARWFRALTRLEGIPFNYLVPDERLLPPESIRFFVVDPAWLNCLRDGAFSLGRVLHQDHLGDHARAEGLDEPPRISGFLLRSAAVAGWPGLAAAGYAKAKGTQAGDDEEIAWTTHTYLQELDAYDMLPILRFDRLAPDVALCLFHDEQGREIEFADLHLHPETLHFGLEPDGQGGLIKKLRNPANGEPLGLWREDVDHPDLEVKLTKSSLDALRTAQVGQEVIDQLAELEDRPFKKVEDRDLKEMFMAELKAALGEARWNEYRELIWRHTSKFVLDEIDMATMWRDESAGVIDATRLFGVVADRLESSKLGSSSAADFGMQMLDAAPLVRFRRHRPKKRAGESV